MREWRELHERVEDLALEGWNFMRVWGELARKRKLFGCRN